MHKPYTRLGDDGTSAIRTGGRIPKNDLVFELLGTLDETNAFLSLASIHISDQPVRNLIERIVLDLHDMMAAIAGDNKIEFGQTRIDWLEEEIVRYGAGISMPKEFINTWRNPASALLNISRAIIRRAERNAISYLGSNRDVHSYWLPYLNRLSSLVYVLQLNMEFPAR